MQKFCVLTSKLFFCCSVSAKQRTTKTPKGYVPINWKSFEPFCEANSEVELFGFRLGREGNCQDFYVNNGEELDSWLNSFRTVSILSGIDDDYCIETELGRGSYGTIYSAISKDTGELVALKRIAKATLRRSSHGARLLENEIAYMRRLDHPNIIRLLRVYEEAHAVYLVVEHMLGGDMFTRVTEADLRDEKYSAMLASKLLSALEHMHSRNIVHRDLKLENIMMTSLAEMSDVKVIDFGLAADMESTDMQSYCGSPGYIAPEILGRLPYDHKADMFSLGIILFTTLTGCSPFFHFDVEETLLKNAACQIEYDLRVWDHFSGDAKEFVQALLQIDPSARLSAGEAMKHRWIQRHTQGDFELREPRQSKRSKPRIILGLVEAVEFPRTAYERCPRAELSPTIELSGGLLTTGQRFLGGAQHTQPSSPGGSFLGQASPLDGESKSPLSAGSNRRKITWSYLHAEK
jgi:serine/threonine protein kinase